MIDELKKAIEKAEKLSKTEQHVMAQLILDEINWNQTLDNTQEKLSFLAQEALQEYKRESQDHCSYNCEFHHH
jgi:hypothetical protein